VKEKKIKSNNSFMNDQKVLLRIVQTWNLSPKAEYRGFRCANCQNYMKKARYHYLVTGGYKTPVHFCNKCEDKFKSNSIEIKKPIIKVKKSGFISKFQKDIKKKLEKISGNWTGKTKPIFKIFTCDDCGINIYKANHMWVVLKGILIELHFCKKCYPKYL